MGEEELLALDPGVVTQVAGAFIEKLQVAWLAVANYAYNSLYLFAAFELVIFGLLWALQRNVGIERLFFRVIKIGLIFFIISNYSWLIEVILRSFTQIAGDVVDFETLKSFLSDPSKLWQFGYDAGVNLLKMATHEQGLGLALIQIILGLGILFNFGYLGIEVVLQLVGFYLVALGGLIVLPFGVFEPTRKLFDEGVRSLIKAGMRLMTTMIIVGVMVAIWNQFDLTPITETTAFNLNLPLGLFFSALLALSLVKYLPKMMGEMVGNLSGMIFADKERSAHINVDQAAPSVLSSGVMGADSSSGMSSIVAATTVTGYGLAAEGASVTVTSNGGENFGRTALAAKLESDSRNGLKVATAQLSRSISEATVKKMKSDLGISEK